MIRKFFLPFYILCSPLFAAAQVSSLNLLVNGDFESGGSGNGFQVLPPYNFIATLTGNSNPGDYAVIPNPQPMNTAFFISGTDHSGTGKMLVIDGSAIGGNPRFWKAGSNGGGVGPLTVGQSYTFSYWIKSIATSVVDVSTTANIQVNWNNASNISLISGNVLAPYPGNTATWQKVIYSFTATTPFVNIELSNNNTNSVGNDFAIDDVEVLAPPIPLVIRYSVVDPSCPNANDGFITVYGSGGTPPYTYSYNGGAYTSNNVFGGLGTVTNAFVSIKDATTPTAVVVVSPSNISLTPPTNTLTIRPDSTICSGAVLPLYAGGSSTGYTWSAAPADASIANPNAQNTTASPTQNTTYTVTTSVTRNRSLIYNGDFEQGNVGFESQYTYFPFPPNPANAGFAQRAYSIVNNAQQFEPQFQLCVDHTTGAGKFMAIDGATVANIKLWSQKVAVTPNTTYTVQYWLQSIDAASPAQLEMQVNGSPITGNATTSTATATTTTCSWAQITYTWNSGSNTTAELTLINRNLSSNGNDFSIDDISMTHTVVCTFTKSCNITVTSGGTPVTNFNYNSPVCINGNNPVPTLGTGFTTGGAFTSTAGLSINGSTGVINLATSTPGTYTVTYSIAAGPCHTAGNSAATISINSALLPPTAIPIVPYCQNQSVTALTATGTGLLWYTNATGGAGSAIAPLPSTASAGTSIFYVSQSSGGCESPRTPITVIVSPSPPISAGPDKSITTGGSVQLEASIANQAFYQFQWNPTAFLSDPRLLQPVASPPSTTRYVISATDSRSGCSAVDTMQVDVFTNLFIPTAFTPNKDGKNDTWEIQGLVMYPTAKVYVFERAGQLVFESSNYGPLFWDGNFKGKLLPIGVYIYMIQLNDEKKTLLKGTLTIIY